MSLEIRADYSEQLLFPAALEDYVPSDHLARFIRDVVDCLDLPGLGFPDRASLEGRPSYSSDLLLKVWLYGYVLRIRSSRRLEQACRDHLGLVWLTGRHAPDHNTLWRFFADHRPALKSLFKQVVQVAAEAGMVGMVLHAVDGTKLKARSSNRTGWHAASLQRVLAKLDASIEAGMREIDVAESTESGSLRLPAALTDAITRKAMIQQKLQELDRRNARHHHPLEPEARMQQAGPERAFGFNAQSVVDAKHGIAVAETVVAQENDFNLLVPMVEEVRSMLGATATDTVADKGYASSAELGRLEDRGLEATVALPKSLQEEAGPYAASQFTYDAAANVMICPRGIRLPFLQKKQREEGFTVDVYQCQSAGTCPVRSECCTNKQGRLVSINPHYPAIQKQQQKHRDPVHREHLKRRKDLIELVFAQVKEHEGFRRWTVRGLKKVQAQWSFLMTAYNLKKLYTLWKKNSFRMPERSGCGTGFCYGIRG
jgi:transposase